LMRKEYSIPKFHLLPLENQRLTTKQKIVNSNKRGTGTAICSLCSLLSALFYVNIRKSSFHWVVKSAYQSELAPEQHVPIADVSMSLILQDNYPLSLSFP